MASLQAMTAFGTREAAVVTVGPLTITERIDVALASVAARRGKDLAGAAIAAGVPLPEPARHRGGRALQRLLDGPRDVVRRGAFREP